MGRVNRHKGQASARCGDRARRFAQTTVEPLAVAGSIMLAVTQPTYAITARWLTPTTNTWDVPTWWSTNPYAPNNNVPQNSHYDAIIDASGGAYTVTARGITVDTMTINSSDATVVFAGDNLAVPQISVLAGMFTASGGITTATNITIGASSSVGTAQMLVSTASTVFVTTLKVYDNGDNPIALPDGGSIFLTTLE